MSFFKRKKEITQYDRDKLMAKEIIEYLGSEKGVFDKSIAGGSYNEHIYEGYGLKLVYSDYYGLFIFYNGEKVLGSNYVNNDNDINKVKEYKPGKWERLLMEIYYNIPTLSYSKRKDDSLYKKGMDVLHLIDTVGKCTISDNLCIERTDNYTGINKNEYEGTTYNVIYEDELVFNGFVSNNSEKVYLFEPGEWIQDIKDYRQQLINYRRSYKK